MGGPFCDPFCGGPFCAVFDPPKMQKRTLKDFRKKMTKISDFVFFIWVIFLQKREIFAYFGCTFKFSMFLTPGANATQGPWGKFRLF